MYKSATIQLLYQFVFTHRFNIPREFVSLTVRVLLTDMVLTNDQTYPTREAPLCEMPEKGGNSRAASSTVQRSVIRRVSTEEDKDEKRKKKTSSIIPESLTSPAQDNQLVKL